MVMDLSLLLLSNFLKNFEIDLSQHLGCLLAKILQEPWYRFRFSDRIIKLVDQGITLQQFQPFQFVNADQVAEEHGFDLVHFGLVGRSVLKIQIMIDQVKDPIFSGMFK